MSTIYYKVINHTKIHYDFVYKDGLNVLDRPFEDHGSCVPGGLYFTTINNITEFYGYGIYLYEVFLPTSDPDFKMVVDPAGNKYRANKIILGKKYSLFDVETYKKFNLNIMDNLELINFASANGLVYILEWWKASGLKLYYNENAINFASRNGHVNVLEWWKTSGFRLYYNKYAMDWASLTGHVDVLEWWKNSRLKLQYTGYAIIWASRYDCTAVLEWWRTSGLEFE